LYNFNFQLTDTTWHEASEVSTRNCKKVIEDWTVISQLDYTMTKLPRVLVLTAYFKFSYPVPFPAHF